MIWESPFPNANMSSDYQDVATAMASGTPTLDLSADDQGSSFDQTEFVTHVRVGAELDPLDLYSGAYQTMLASERVLRKDWDEPEEEAAWAYL
jgi:hypothetical protein